MSEPRAALITGLYGVGKSTVLEEVADILERAGIRYAALDLDWLAWAWTSDDEDHGAEAHALLLEHLDLVVVNLRRRGNDRFVLAGTADSAATVRDISATMAMPVAVVRLTLPLDEVRRRLSTSPTSGRADDLARTEAAMAAGDGDERQAHLVVANDRPVQDVARAIVDWLDWLPSPERAPG